jgi:hypothetical protein
VDFEVVEEVDSRRVARTRTVAGVKAKELPKKGLRQATGEAAAPLTVAVEARRSPEEGVVVSPRCPFEYCCLRRHRRTMLQLRGMGGVAKRFGLRLTVLEASNAHLSI